MLVWYMAKPPSVVSKLLLSSICCSSQRSCMPGGSDLLTLSNISRSMPSCLKTTGASVCVFFANPKAPSSQSYDLRVPLAKIS